MSFIDTLKGLVGKGKEAASQNSDKVHGAVDKAAQTINDKTGGKYEGQIGKASDAAKNYVKPKDEQGGEQPPQQG
ncbi:antitoxin [Rhodococcus sp. NPDC058521]|uniref:antitoxin n=1 Tax=Rhodococcus sp. NPDC058521 TaxID=3346536 RepID=UPI00365771CD